jgi:hypothetical protein
VGEALAAALFVPWLAATLAAAKQTWRTARVVRRWDVLRLVPDWVFFAPNPGTSDYRLLARLREPDGSTSEFTEIPTGTGGVRRSIWHPEKRISKTIYDCARALIELEGERREGAEYTLAYLTLLNLVESRLDRSGPAKLQFLLLRVTPYLDEPQLIVRSGFHPLPA